MPYWIITFFLGTCALALCRKLPSLGWLLVLIPMIIVGYLTHCFNNFKTTIIPQLNCSPLSKIWLLLLTFALGCSWSLIYAHWITAWNLPPELEGKKILVTGYVSAPPINKFYGTNFELQTETINGISQHTKLKLNWYHNYLPMHAGDKWQLLTRLKRPYGTLNPGGFDLEQHLIMHHIRATGYVVNAPYNRILASNWHHYPLSRLRQLLINKIEQALANDALAPIIIAVVTGAEDKITPPQWQVMRDTGTSSW